MDRINLIQIGAASDESDVWNMLVYAELYRRIFGTSLTLDAVSFNKLSNHSKEYKYQTMSKYVFGVYHLIQKTVDTTDVMDMETVIDIGIVNIAKDVIEHRDVDYTYISSLGILNSEQGMGYGSKALKQVVEKYPDAIIKVHYPKNDIMDREVEFYFDAGFTSRATIVKGEEKYLLMSTRPLVTLDEYMEHSENMYPILKSVDDKIDSLS